MTYTFETIAAVESATVPATTISLETLRRASGNKRSRTAWSRSSLNDIQTACGEPERSTVLCAQLTGATGATAFKDESRHKHTLSSFGQANVAAGGPTVYGLPMTYFDGNGDLVSTPANDVFGPAGDFTIHFYARCEDLAATRLLFAYHNASSPGTNNYSMTVQTDGSLVFRQLEAGVTTVEVLTATGTIVAGTTYHISLVRYGDDWTIRVNGASAGTATDSTPLAKFDNLFRIGSLSVLGHMKGWISQFHFVERAIWSVDFTPSDPLKRYPASAYFRSTDRFLPSGATDATQGGYWLLDTDCPELTQFGGVADGVLSTSDNQLSGTDNADAFDALLSYMAVRRCEGRVPPGTYNCSREITHDVDQILRGSGMDKTIVSCRLGEAEIAVRAYPTGSGGGLCDLTVIAEPYTSKLSGQGQYHACVGVCGIYFSAQPLPVMTYFRLDGIRCRRAGVSGGYGVYCMGNIGAMDVGHIDDIGNRKRHTGLYTQHWAGRVLNGGTGFESEETYHPRNIEVGLLHATASSNACVLSCSYNTRIKKIVAEGCSRLFYWLPGDETNRLAVATQKHKIGHGIVIDEIFFSDMVTDIDNAIDLFSVGTSTFENFPAPDDTIRRRGTLYTEISIGKIHGRNLTPQDMKLIDAFQWYGRLHIDEIDVGNSFAGKILDFDRSYGGKVTIGEVVADVATAGVSCIEITKCDDITIDEARISHSDRSSSSSRCVYVGGDIIATTLAADATEGETAIAIVAMADRVLKGQRLTVNGHVVQATENTPIGMTTIKVTPLPANVTGGDAVMVDATCDMLDIGLHTKGGRKGITIGNARAVLRGPGPCESGQYGIECQSGANVDLMSTMMRANGLARKTEGTLATREIIVSVGAVMRHHGGELGVDPAYVLHNVACPTSDGSTDRRYMAFGVRYRGAITGRVSAGDASDFEMIGCTDASGASVTS